jgi:hypothetical protein
MHQVSSIPVKSTTLHLFFLLFFSRIVSPLRTNLLKDGEDSSPTCQTIQGGGGVRVWIHKHVSHFLDTLDTAGWDHVGRYRECAVSPDYCQ